MLLPRAVAPDDAEELPVGDIERDVVDRLQLVVVVSAERVQDPLLERGVLLVGEAERLADALDRDRARATQLGARRRGEGRLGGGCDGGQGHVNASNSGHGDLVSVRGLLGEQSRQDHSLLWRGSWFPGVYSLSLHGAVWQV